MIKTDDGLSRSTETLLNHPGTDSVFVIGNPVGGTSLYHFAYDYPGRCRGIMLLSSVVPGDKKSFPPRFLMKAVFGSDIIYWSSVRLFGRSMSAIFIPKEVFNSLPEGERKTMKSSIYLSSLPVSARTNGILFEMYVSNLSIDETFPLRRSVSWCWLYMQRMIPHRPIPVQ